MPIGDHFCFRVTLQEFIDDKAYEIYQSKAANKSINISINTCI